MSLVDTGLRCLLLHHVMKLSQSSVLLLIVSVDASNDGWLWCDYLSGGMEGELYAPFTLTCKGLLEDCPGTRET